MLEQMIQMMQTKDLVGYFIAAELFFLLLLSLRTNGLLKKTLRLRSQKKEQLNKLKEEVKKGSSDIPVVKFEKAKPQEKTEKSVRTQGTVDPKEMAVLQEMMSEFFG